MDLSVGDDETVLITGPTLSGRRRLFHRTLGESAGRPVVVSTREPANCVRSSHRRLVDGDEATPVVVDCITNALGRSADDTATTKYAQHPSDLTSIGAKFTDALGERESDRLSVGLTNLGRSHEPRSGSRTSHRCWCTRLPPTCSNSSTCSSSGRPAPAGRWRRRSTARVPGGQVRRPDATASHEAGAIRLTRSSRDRTPPDIPTSLRPERARRTRSRRR